MKNNIFLFLIVIISLSSCGGSSPEAVPTDLAGWEKLLNEKSQELVELKSEIEEIERQILKLTPKDRIKQKLVTIDTLSRTEFNQYTQVQASVVAEDYVSASSEVGGLITNLYVKEGDYVQKGQRIASVDMAPMEEQLEELKTSYSLAETVFERQERLWNKNIGSELQYLEAKNNKERLEQSIASLSATIKKKHVFAPISGYIDMEFLQPGEIAAPGMPIVNILNTRKLKLVADVPENYLGSVKKGDLVDVVFPAIDLSIQARVQLLGRQIDPSNRTFKIEFDVSAYADRIKPNLLAKVNLNNYSNPEAIVLQADLIQKNVEGKKFVYTVSKKADTMYAKQVFVTTGESFDNNIEITSGLNENDLIIVKGARSVNDGNVLTIQNAQ